MEYSLSDAGTRLRVHKDRSARNFLRALRIHANIETLLQSAAMIILWFAMLTRGKFSKKLLLDQRITNQRFNRMNIAFHPFRLKLIAIHVIRIETVESEWRTKEMQATSLELFN